MRRRLVVAMAAVTALALVLAGLLSLLLVRRSARDSAERELVDQAIAIASRAGTAETFQVLARVSSELRFDAIARVTFTTDGRVAGQLPEQLSPADLRPDLLSSGHAVSGVVGGTVYAAAPVRGAAASGRPAEAVTAIVVTRAADDAHRRAAGWFVVAAGVSLLAAALVASELGRRFSRPVRAAQEVTARIAAGDLEARVTDRGGGPELVQLARSVNAMAEALSRAQELERDFLMSISHDLRTPLTSITGYAEAIADGVTPEPASAAAVIGTEARRLERLVGDLLELAKIGARQFSLDLREVDAFGVVRTAVAGLQQLAADAQVRLRCEAVGEASSGAAPGPHHASSLTVVSDPDRLGQIVVNLVENALNHAAAEVVVTVAQRGSVLEITVDDDGPGIPEADRERVFERFHRGDRQRGRAIGSGIGLAIVRELSVALGGTATAERAPLGGSRMIVRVAARWSSSSMSSRSTSGWS